jgi:hypothetical protein
MLGKAGYGSMSVTRLTPVLDHSAPRALGAQSCPVQGGQAPDTDHLMTKGEVAKARNPVPKDAPADADNPGPDG